MRNSRVWMLVCLCLCVSGCASLVADRIMRGSNMDVDGNISELIIKKEFCADDESGGDKDCVTAQQLSPSALSNSKNLSFAMNIDGQRSLWTFSKSELSSSETDTVIIVFPGYGQASQILFDITLNSGINRW